MDESLTLRTNIVTRQRENLPKELIRKNVCVSMYHRHHIAPLKTLLSHENTSRSFIQRSSAFHIEFESIAIAL